MHVLRVHNRYQERGGEDVSFEAEVQMLRDNGQDVQTLVLSNKDIADDRSVLHSIRLAGSTIWSINGRKQVSQAIASSRADVVHFDNTLPLISPAAYSAAQDAGVAVVQTLHNYRLLCPSATFFREGKVCEDCLGRTPPLPGILHGCYRESRAQTSVIAAMLTTHRLRGTWYRDVDRYIALTEFARDKFIAGGLPAEKIVIKPNFVPDCLPAREGEGGYMLFVGRLASEKGIATMLHAWGGDHTMPPLRIAGDGPERTAVTGASYDGSGIKPLGRLSKEVVMKEMVGARALIFPSEWFEGMPLTLLEALASGVPIIASRQGGIPEIVEDGHTGLLFTPGDAENLATKVRWAWEHPDEMSTMGKSARREYEAKYTPTRNFDILMQIYEQARATKSRQ